MNKYRVFKDGVGMTYAADSYRVERCGALTFVKYFSYPYQVDPPYYALITFAPGAWDRVELTQENPDEQPK